MPVQKIECSYPVESVRCCPRRQIAQACPSPIRSLGLWRNALYHPFYSCKLYASKANPRIELSCIWRRNYSVLTFITPPKHHQMISRRSLHGKGGKGAWGRV